ncbi:hypothetical protein FRC06_003108, partial [Ceratobasidium sp. 370]
MSRSRQNSVDDESFPAVPGGFNFGSRPRRQETRRTTQPAPPPIVSTVDEPTRSSLAFPSFGSPDEEASPVSALNQTGPGIEHEGRESNSPVPITPTVVTGDDEVSHPPDTAPLAAALEFQTQLGRSSLAFPEIASPVESPTVDDAPAYIYEQVDESESAVEAQDTVGPEAEPGPTTAVDSEDIPIDTQILARSATPVRSFTPTRPATPVRSATPVHPATPVHSATPIRSNTP